MKKTIYSLFVAIPLAFVACEPEDLSTEGDGSNSGSSNGYWDVTCTTVYDSVAVTICDSTSGNNAGWETVCDSIMVVDSVDGSHFWEVDCQQVQVNSGSSSVDCYTSYELVATSVCDSIWVETDSNSEESTDSTDHHVCGTCGGPDSTFIDSTSVSW